MNDRRHARVIQLGHEPRGVFREVAQHTERLVRQADRVLSAPQALVGYIKSKGFK